MIRTATGITPVSRSKTQARKNYDRMSRFYDLIAGWSEKKPRSAGLRLLAAQPGERVLEIGYGTGHCLKALAQATGESGQVSGIDISEGMKTVASNRLTAAGLRDRVRLHCGDAASLPFESSSMDAVFSSFTIELFDTAEIPVVLEECRRVTRNGGRICVVSLSKEHPSRMTHLYERVHQRFPVTIDCRPIFARQSLENAGFRIEQNYELSWWAMTVELVLARNPA